MKIIRCHITLLIALFSCGNIYSQCSNQIFHTSGSSDINGIQVTVTSTGDFDTTSTCIDAQPYWIGGASNGSYTFQFSPTIDSLVLNLSSIHNSGSGFEEIVKIDVNGNHYSIPSIGGTNSCSPYLPILTAEGNLAAQPNSERAGCNGITIPGPVSEITIIDSVVIGNGGGALFSLFICSESIVSIPEIDVSDFLIYPIPTTEQITIKSLSNSIKEINLFDNLGRKQNLSTSILEGEGNIDVSNLPYGIYNVVIHTKDQITTRKVIVGVN